KHVSYAELTGYAHDGSQAIADALKDGPVKKTEEGALGGLMDTDAEAEAVNKLLAALAPALQGVIDKWIDSEGGQALLQGIAEWTEEHPRTVMGILGGAVIGAAVAAYLSDYDPGEFAKTFKLGDKWSVGGAVDLASVQQLINKGIDGAKLFAEYKSGEFTGKLGGAWSAEDGASVEGSVAYDGEHLDASASGSYSEKNGHKVAGQIAYENEGVSAVLKGEHTGDGHKVEGKAGYKTEGFEAEVHAANTQDGTSYGGSAKGQGRIGNFTGQYDGSLEMDQAGRATLKLGGGLEGMIGDSEAKGGLNLRHAVGGDKAADSRVEAEVQIGDDAEHRKVSGWLDPNNGSFQLDMSQVSGGATHTQSTGKDAEGNAFNSERVQYQGDGINFDANQKQVIGGDRTSGLNLGLTGLGGRNTNANLGLTTRNGQTESLNAGLSFDMGRLRNELDLEMRDGVTTMGVTTKGQFGDFTAGADAKFNLTDSRLQELGLQLGYQNPDEFKSFALDYRAQWMEEHAEYAHNFDATFEYAIGNVAARFKGGAQLQGGDMTKANADLLAGYRLNPDWVLLGGADYQHNQVDGARSNQFGVRAGVQYKDVAVTVGATRFSDRDDTQFGIRLEIPLW
ncbi:MAG: hypothetical protein H6702_23830, partial [Myxococcales bacterium]|nr:hypothetical protein [Myxococcales bacterium]